MKINIIVTLLFSILSFTNNYAQKNSRATYKLLLSKNGYAPVYYELLNQPSKSSFKFIKRKIPEKVVIDDETGGVTLNPVRPDSIQPLIITDFKANRIFSKEYLTENDGGSYKEIHIHEPISVNWVFQKGTKKIGNYLCKNAVTSFRGRNYSVWYSEEIPIPIGPWKFHGLPGLIFEIKDDSGEVSFFVEKINYPYNQPIVDNLDFFVKTISIDDFFILKKNARKKTSKVFEAKILSKLPRGATIELTKDGNNDIEKRLQN